jgi:hypothetical protein
VHVRFLVCYFSPHQWHALLIALFTPCFSPRLATATRRRKRPPAALGRSVNCAPCIVTAASSSVPPVCGQPQQNGRRGLSGGPAPSAAGIVSTRRRGSRREAPGVLGIGFAPAGRHTMHVVPSRARHIRAIVFGYVRPSAPQNRSAARPARLGLPPAVAMSCARRILPHPQSVESHPTHPSQTPPRRSRPCAPGGCCLRQTPARPARPSAPPHARHIEHDTFVAPCVIAVHLLARGTRPPAVAAPTPAAGPRRLASGRCAPHHPPPHPPPPSGGGGSSCRRRAPEVIDTARRNF